MQAYALAVRELLPSLANAKIRVTLHFLDPNVEVHLADELLEPRALRAGIDEAMQRTIFSCRPRKLSCQNRASLSHVQLPQRLYCRQRMGRVRTGPQMSTQDQTQLHGIPVCCRALICV